MLRYCSNGLLPLHIGDLLAYSAILHSCDQPSICRPLLLLVMSILKFCCLLLMAVKSCRWLGWSMKLHPLLGLSQLSQGMTGPASWKKFTRVPIPVLALGLAPARGIVRPATPWSRLWGMTHQPSSPTTIRTRLQIMDGTAGNPPGLTIMNTMAASVSQALLVSPSPDPASLPPLPHPPPLPSLLTLLVSSTPTVIFPYFSMRSLWLPMFFSHTFWISL